jgi:hypothetical protein
VDADRQENQTEPQPRKYRMLKAYILGIALGVILYALLRALHLPLGIELALIGLAWMAALFGKQLTGSAEHIQIFSPAFEHRIRGRYRSESSQLSNLGFTPLFLYGEGFPLVRLFLIYPAFLFLFMWLNREAVTIEDRSKLVFGFPVFASSDGATYAHPNQLGMKFHTLFQDGTILMIKSFGGKTKYGSRVIVHIMRNSSTKDAWAEHQKQIQLLEATGKQIDRKISFEAFSFISREA